MDLFTLVFFQEVGSNLRHRLRHGLPHQEPDVLIELYNSAVDHLQLVCAQVSQKLFSGDLNTRLVSNLIGCLMPSEFLPIYATEGRLCW